MVARAAPATRAGPLNAWLDFSTISVYTPIMRSSEFDECRACVCFAVRKAARAVTQHYDRALRPYGLRAPQFNLLAMLAQTGPLPMVKLAEWLGLDRTSLTRNLRRPAEKIPMTRASATWPSRRMASRCCTR
jgi:hypothetical protein